ncbi:hypothetical protein Pmani_018007 [Petrolisthes manimaculis]|uniref:Uncharacterized protein n=1 Tax=Petrolisthes manimaculis TaxID=1843537 RepID=A0AAE1U988_9EUCA|nr:hypothetical protein Pmani_018007 [Petrolisthes manimaculis]
MEDQLYVLYVRNVYIKNRISREDLNLLLAFTVERLKERLLPCHNLHKGGMESTTEPQTWRDNNVSNPLVSSE